jgi:hypothetical protein
MIRIFFDTEFLRCCLLKPIYASAKQSFRER